MTLRCKANEIWSSIRRMLSWLGELRETYPEVLPCGKLGRSAATQAADGHGMYILRSFVSVVGTGPRSIKRKRGLAEASASCEACSICIWLSKYRHFQGRKY